MASNVSISSKKILRDRIFILKLLIPCFRNLHHHKITNDFNYLFQMKMYSSNKLIMNLPSCAVNEPTELTATKEVEK